MGYSITVFSDLSADCQENYRQVKPLIPDSYCGQQHLSRIRLNREKYLSRIGPKNRGGEAGALGALGKTYATGERLTKPRSEAVVNFLFLDLVCCGYC